MNAAEEILNAIVDTMEINYGIKITLNREEKMETREEIAEQKKFNEVMDWFRNQSMKDKIDILIESGVLDDAYIKVIAEERWYKIRDYLEA